jgi:hypothetical protein
VKVKEVVLYAVLDKKGKIISDEDLGMLIFKTKKAASCVLEPDDEETVQKVRITEV